MDQNRLDAQPDSAISNPVPMSSASHGGRFRTWRFSHILHTSLIPQACSGLAPSTAINPEDTILSLFKNMFMIKEKPDCVVYIHLRVSRAAFDNCVSCGKASAPLPDLPFTGYMQANGTIEQKLLIKWSNIQWDPVGGSLMTNNILICFILVLLYMI